MIRAVYPRDALAAALVGYAMLVPIEVSEKSGVATRATASMSIVIPLGEIIVESCRAGAVARLEWFLSRSIYTPSLLLVSRLWEELVEEAELVVDADLVLVARSTLRNTEGDVVIDTGGRRVTLPYMAIAREAIRIISEIAGNNREREKIMKAMTVKEKTAFKTVASIIAKDGCGAGAVEKMVEATRSLLAKP